MTRTLRSVGLALVLLTAGLGGTMLAWTGGGAGAQGGGTPLPAGWELCVLEGLASPATPANVTDLDEWQAAEGGSTNNTAAFNPFNTGRTIDVTGAPIPGVVPSSNGFPAFPNWPAGCVTACWRHRGLDVELGQVLIPDIRQCGRTEPFLQLGQIKTGGGDRDSR